MKESYTIDCLFASAKNTERCQGSLRKQGMVTKSLVCYTNRMHRFLCKCLPDIRSAASDVTGINKKVRILALLRNHLYFEGTIEFFTSFCLFLPTKFLSIAYEQFDLCNSVNGHCRLVIYVSKVSVGI